MNIEVPEIDATNMAKRHFDIVDSDTNMIIGFLECGRSETGPAPQYSCHAIGRDPIAPPASK